MKKIILIILIIIATIIILILWSIGSWKSHDPYWESKKRYHLYKSIIFENEIDSTSLIVKANFRYSEKDSLHFMKNKSDSLMYFEEIDSLSLEPYMSSFLYLIPILKSDSTIFPKSFYIRIYEENTNTLLKELNYDSFKRYAIPEYMTNDKNFLTANQWTLVIDSTLLELK